MRGDFGACCKEALTCGYLPVPAVFAEHGLTLIAALELALPRDLLIAAEGASFGLVETVAGLTPPLGGLQRVAERAGPARAKRRICSGVRCSARVLER
ncbi:enoyl-CoA hydratase-related protein [Streptomyces sp. NPDC001544]|uniref:enoyl-CoA hydratase-related protein n=1 Tax=Streptomyces sp. NPDC001544 TaxID=3364584 RepID=UPI003699577C